MGEYVARLAESDLGGRASLLTGGLDALDAEASARFAAPLHALSLDRQDEVLGRVEAGDVLADWRVPPRRFFELLVHLTSEAYYGDPGNGGNRGQVAWEMIGYEPRGQTRDDPEAQTVTRT